MDNPVIPTGDPRHISHVREGRQSGEVWSRYNRAGWHEEYDGPLPNWGKLKEVVNANQHSAEGSEEGVSADAKTVRDRKRKTGVLRPGKGQGNGEKPVSEGEKRLQKRIKAKKVSK